MANEWKRIKAANSKGDLVKHIQGLHNILKWYADESNWAVKDFDDPNLESVIVWLGDDDPTYAAQLGLGTRKPDPRYINKWSKKDGRSSTQSKDDKRDGGGAQALERGPKGDAEI